jgi:hypothetical protein
MRARDDERTQWFRAFEQQRMDFLQERMRWEEERARLVNALLAKSSGEFALRQKVSIPEPLTDVPREAREAPLQPMGL